MGTLFKLALLGASICMFVEGVRTWPTPFDRKSDVIAEVIDDHDSLEIREKSFHNVMRAMGQE